jgi:hypothetical protein
MTARILAVALALSVAYVAPVAAQGMSENDKEDEFNALFQEGLKSITARNLDRSEKLFKACVQLYPDRPTAYYNLACTLSLANNPEKSVEWLKQAYEKGFRDLAHMSRDMDLDPIRRTPAYRAARGELEAQALQGVPAPLTTLPKGDGPCPLIVFVHDDRGNPIGDMTTLRETVSAEYGLFVPQGPLALRDGSRAWDQRAEFLVIRQLREFLAANPRVDGSRVYLIGRGISGYRSVGFLAQHGETFACVLAAGPALDAGLGELEPAGERAYLVVHKDDAAQVASGRHARDVFVDSGSQVVLERYAGEDPLADRAVLLRGLAWLEGKDVQLPGEGAERSF